MRFHNVYAYANAFARVLHAFFALYNCECWYYVSNQQVVFCLRLNVSNRACDRVCLLYEYICIQSRVIIMRIEYWSCSCSYTVKTLSFLRFYSQNIVFGILVLVVILKSMFVYLFRFSMMDSNAVTSIIDIVNQIMFGKWPSKGKDWFFFCLYEISKYEIVDQIWYEKYSLCSLLYFIIRIRKFVHFIHLYNSNAHNLSQYYFSCLNTNWSKMCLTFIPKFKLRCEFRIIQDLR